MSRRWPGWEDLSGINIEGGCNAALKQGSDYVRMDVAAGPEGADGPLDMYPVGFYADGHVALVGVDDDWECVVEDGMLTGFLYKPQDLKIKLVKALFAQVGNSALPWMHYYVGGEMINGDVTFTDVIDSAIDTSAEDREHLPATLSIALMKDPDTATMATWPLTPDSAMTLIGLMRERHGDPVGQALVDGDTLHGLGDMLGASEKSVVLEDTD